MQGSLADTCLSDVLRNIYLERLTGELVVTQADITKEIYFELGQIVFAGSNRKEERLGETLVRHGKLTRDRLSDILAKVGPNRYFGKILVEEQIVTDRELITFVNFQIIGIIYSLFGWTIGEYKFLEREESQASEDLKLRFSTATIILEGVRRIEDFDIIRRGLGDINRLILPAVSPLLRMQSIVLNPIERNILDIIKQPTDILKLLILSKEAPQKSLQALYGLLSIGLLEHGEEAEVSPETGRLTASLHSQNLAATAPPLENTRRNNVENEDAIMTTVAKMKTLVASQDARAILGLTATASSAELLDAYYSLSAKFHPDKFLDAPFQLREDVDYIFAGITDSYNKLRSRTTMSNIRPTIPGFVSQPSTTKIAALSAGDYKRPTEPVSDYELPSDANNIARSLAPIKPINNPSMRSGGRAISDEMSYSASANRPVGIPSKSANIEEALNDLLDFLDDRKAPLFVADSLSMLFRTKPPIQISMEQVIQTIVTWSRQKATTTGRPIHEVFVYIINCIKHAEQAGVMKEFDSTKFFPGFIEGLAEYCPPGERSSFLTKASMI